MIGTSIKGKFLSFILFLLRDCQYADSLQYLPFIVLFRMIYKVIIHLFLFF